MGAWGVKSYENDETMDNIDDNVERKESKKGIQRKWTTKSLKGALQNSEFSCDDPQCYVGTLRMALESKCGLNSPRCKVTEGQLNEGYRRATSLIKDKEYLNRWTDPKKKKKELEFEAEMFKTELRKIL